MRASIQWLRELTGLELSVPELAEKLTSIGLEVDAIEHFDAPAHVVVGEIRSKEKHPDKDRLSIVSFGSGVSASDSRASLVLGDSRQSRDVIMTENSEIKGQNNGHTRREK